MREFGTKNDVDVAREKHRQDKVAQTYSNSKGHPQDDMEWDQEIRKDEPCPGCGQYFTMTMENRDTIDVENMAIKAYNNKRLQEFDNLLATEKKDKKKGQAHSIGCYCFCINCLFQQSGGACPSYMTMNNVGKDHFIADMNGNH